MRTDEEIRRKAEEKRRKSLGELMRPTELALAARERARAGKVLVHVDVPEELSSEFPRRYE